MAWVKKQDDAGNLIFEETGNIQAASEVIFRFATGVELAIGRGTTDTDIMAVRMRNADGETAYIFPDADQTGITVQASRP